MAYRFNSSRGGVTCDECNILVQEDLSYAQYEAQYADFRKANGGRDLCIQCKAKGTRLRRLKAE